MRNMGGAPALVFLSLLLSVTSANVYKPTASDAGRNPPFMDENIGLHDLEKVFKNEFSTFSGYPAEFSELCLEISRKAKTVINDPSLINEIDSLTSTLCHMVPSDLEAKLDPCEVCTTCRDFLDIINNVLGDTERQFLMLVYFLKSCDNQTTADECKKKVFQLAPIIMTVVQMIVSEDICYIMHICEDPKIPSARYADRLYMGKSEPHPQGKHCKKNLM